MAAAVGAIKSTILHHGHILRTAVHHRRSDLINSRYTRPRFSTAIFVLSACLLAACTGLRPGYETPTVTVNSFRTLPSEGVIPNFEIGLHVINPNREALNVRGMSYTVRLAGHELIKGVANDLPVIDPYGEGEFKVTAAANLFAGIRVVTDLMRGAQDSFDYDLEAKLDVGTFFRSIRITDSGKISLRPSAN